MNKIALLAVLLIWITSSSNISAQVIKMNSAGPVIEKFMNSALTKSQGRLVHGQNAQMFFQIMVMSPGNSSNFGLNSGTVRNNVGWYVAYGEAVIPMNTANGKAEFPTTNKSTNSQMVSINSISATGKVNYWFSDRGWNKDDVRKEANYTPPANGHGIFNSNVSDAPFSKPKKEVGELIYFHNSMGTTFDLFKTWKWKVTKAVIVGDMLYGELNNGYYTF